MVFSSPFARVLWLELSCAQRLPVTARALGLDAQGLRVDLAGLAGFVALDAIDIVPEPEPRRWIGRELTALIISYESRPAVLSRRAHIEQAWRTGSAPRGREALLRELQALVHTGGLSDPVCSLVFHLIAGPRRPAVAPPLAEFLAIPAPPTLRAVLIAWSLFEAHDVRVGRLHMDDRWLGRSRSMLVWIKDGPGPHDGCYTRGETRNDVFVLGRGPSGFVTFRRDSRGLHDSITEIDGWVHSRGPGSSKLERLLS